MPPAMYAVARELRRVLPARRAAPTRRRPSPCKHASAASSYSAMGDQIVVQQPPVLLEHLERRDARCAELSAALPAATNACAPRRARRRAAYSRHHHKRRPGRRRRLGVGRLSVRPSPDAARSSFELGSSLENASRSSSSGGRVRLHRLPIEPAATSRARARVGASSSSSSAAAPAAPRRSGSAGRAPRRRVALPDEAGPRSGQRKDAQPGRSTVARRRLVARARASARGAPGSPRRARRPCPARPSGSARRGPRAAREGLRRFQEAAALCP